jgi:hypothetical protein
MPKFSFEITIEEENAPTQFGDKRHYYAEEWLGEVFKTAKCGWLDSKIICSCHENNTEDCDQCRWYNKEIAKIDNFTNNWRKNVKFLRKEP